MARVDLNTAAEGHQTRLHHPERTDLRPACDTQLDPVIVGTNTAGALSRVTSVTVQAFYRNPLRPEA